MDKICFDCIGESFIKDKIKSLGTKGLCDHCELEEISLSVDEIVALLQEGFKSFYYKTSSNPEGYDRYLQAEGRWVQEGDEIPYLLQDLLEVDEEVAEALGEVLSSNLYDRDDHDDSDLWKYGGMSDYQLGHEWEKFEENLKKESRFFGHQPFLEKIFKNVHKFVTENSGSVIATAGPKSALSTIFRARISSSSDFETILKSPETELGPPPYDRSRSGRMNSFGISVFYGAKESTTAVAEVRPYIGAKIILGEFKILEATRLLDLRVLQRIEISGSIFDENYRNDLELKNFLSELTGRLSHPVLPSDEALDYLPTQVIADYLAWDKDLNIHGLIYPSTLVKDGANVVFFKRYSKVDRSTHLDPKTVNISNYYNPEDDEEENNKVTLYIDEETEVEDEPPFDFGFDIFSRDYETSYLQLVRSSLRVETVQAISFESYSTPVVTIQSKGKSRKKTKKPMF